jgi:hypothetical protein
MRGGITPLPNTPSWRGAQLKEAQGKLYIYIYLYGLKAVKLMVVYIFSN